MIVYQGLSDKRLKRMKREVAIGIFDGVHLGHQAILNKARQESKHSGGRFMAITFDPHPNKVLNPQNCQPVIMSLPYRLRLLEDAGCQEVLILRFNKKFSKYSHEAFLRGGLIQKLGMHSISVGRDFRFGWKGRGNIAYLRHESERLGFKLNALTALRYHGRIISSTRIRRLIEKGDLKLAAGMLGKPVVLHGHVTGGKKRGRSIGYPTANIDLHHETLPPDGVYAVWARLGSRKRVRGVMHIGPKPTFGEKDKTLEVYLLNFEQDIYGKEIEVSLVSKLRSNRRFRSKDALVKAIKNDIKKAYKALQ